jgi:catechol 2,3-dioxygenase-like lactoylglutathione lyase family enzyme
VGSERLARRFLHVNLNCSDLEVTERVYGDLLGLKVRMRTDPEVPVNGDILGIDSETYCASVFLYDSRGGRAGCALEAIEFRSPPLARDDCTDPVRPGIRAVRLEVADVDAAAAALRRAGLVVGDPVDGLAGVARTVLATDPDGVVIELTESPDRGGAQFNGIRVAAIDAEATGEFLTDIGFDEVDPPTGLTVAGAQLHPRGSGETDCVVARYAAAEDGDRFDVVVVGHPETTPTPVPWGGNRQGLYRCALRVENLHDAIAALPDSVERMGDPVWCPLPGTKIDGLHITFLRSPDGSVFELVERPLRYFGKPAQGR